MVKKPMHAAEAVKATLVFNNPPKSVVENTA